MTQQQLKTIREGAEKTLDELEAALAAETLLELTSVLKLAQAAQERALLWVDAYTRRRRRIAERAGA